MKSLFAATLLATVAAFAPAAHASLSLMVGDTTIIDNGAKDLAPTLGAITYVGAPGFTLSVNTGSSSTQPSIDLSNVVGSTSDGGTLVIKLTNTDLTSPSGLQNWLTQFTGSVVGAGATVNAKTYIDTSNTAFGLGTPLANLTATGTPFALSSVNAGGGGSPFLLFSPSFGSGIFESFALPFSFFPTSGIASPFSLTEVVTITATGTSNFSLDTQLSPVPEPTSLALLGTTLAGLGALGRRRRTRV